jgi:pectate lyase
MLEMSVNGEERLKYLVQLDENPTLQTVAFQLVSTGGTLGAWINGSWDTVTDQGNGYWSAEALTPSIGGAGSDIVIVADTEYALLLRYTSAGNEQIIRVVETIRGESL